MVELRLSSAGERLAEQRPCRSAGERSKALMEANLTQKRAGASVSRREKRMNSDRDPSEKIFLAAVRGVFVAAANDSLQKRS